MATVTPTVELLTDDILKATWTLTSADSDGAPIGPQHINYADRCFQISSASWGGATAKIEGSMDGTNWFPLNNAYGSAFSASANALTTVGELPLFMRPNLTTVGSGASITVTMIGRKQRSGQSRGG